MAEGGDQTPPFDPLADLMLGLASLILVVTVMVAATQMQAASLKSGGGAAPEPVFTLDGKPVAPFYAKASGISAPLAGAVALADLRTEPRLADEVSRAEAVLLIVEPGGGEAAFVFEALAASAGVRTIAIVRRPPDGAAP